MLFFHKDRTPKGQDRPVNTVKLYFGDYYRDYGGQYSGGKNLLCVMPYHEDGDPFFRNLARSLGVEFLSEFPFVVERLLGGKFSAVSGKGFSVSPIWSLWTCCKKRTYRNIKAGADRCIAGKRMT